MTAVREPVARAEARPRRRQPWLSRKRLPYLLIVPAVIFELFIHVIPLLAGVGISFLGLTQFFIRNWSLAPFVGFDNYRKALDFGGPIGEGLLHSFGDHGRVHGDRGRRELRARPLRGAARQHRVPRPALVPHALPRPLRDAGLRRGDRVELHARPRQRRAQRAALRPPHRRRPAAVLADRLERVLGDRHDHRLAAVAVRVPDGAGRAAEHPRRAARGGGRRRRDAGSSASATSRCRCCAR